MQPLRSEELTGKAFMWEGDTVGDVEEGGTVEDGDDGDDRGEWGTGDAA